MEFMEKLENPMEDDGFAMEKHCGPENWIEY